MVRPGKPLVGRNSNEKVKNQSFLYILKSCFKHQREGLFHKEKK
jgi:hypothetical protein